METRLCNIFKTVSTVTLAKATFESPYKVLQSSQKAATKTTRTIFKGRSILVYFLRLNCHNFYLILTKVAELYFLESTLKCLKPGQKGYSYSHLVRNNIPSKFWKNDLFTDVFLKKQDISNTDFNITQKYRQRIFSFWKM